MTTQHQPTMVGAADPELKNSPVMEERDEEYEVLAQEIEALSECHFNNVAFRDGDYVCSGHGALLCCNKGLWVRQGSCDPDNP